MPVCKLGTNFLIFRQSSGNNHMARHLADCTFIFDEKSRYA